MVVGPITERAPARTLASARAAAFLLAVLLGSVAIALLPALDRRVHALIFDLETPFQGGVYDGAVDAGLGFEAPGIVPPWRLNIDVDEKGRITEEGKHLAPGELTARLNGIYLQPHLIVRVHPKASYKDVLALLVEVHGLELDRFWVVVESSDSVPIILRGSQ